MYNLYILKSLKNGRRYIGIAEDLGRRFNQHNSGKVLSTRAYMPWKLVHQETFSTKEEARKRESELKSHSWKRNELFKNLGI